MKKVILSITDTDNNITISMGNDKYDESLIVSISKPAGVTASSADSADINDIFADTYEYITGSASTSTKTNASVTAIMLREEFVSITIPYKQD